MESSILTNLKENLKTVPEFKYEDLMSSRLFSHGILRYECVV